MHAKLAITAATLLCLVGTASVDQALSREQITKEQLAGTWILDDLRAVTWDEDDRNPFGSSPQGRMVLDRQGRVTFVIVGADRAKFRSADRLAGTAAENKAAVQSTQAFFGTYSVNEKDNSVVFHVERSSFPNWDGSDQTSIMKLDGDELRLTKSGPHASTGYATWKRVKEIQVARER
jgi:lipocalin-like protein